MGYETSGTARWSRRSGTRNKTLEAVMMFGIFSIFRNGWMGKQYSGSTLRIAECQFMVGAAGSLSAQRSRWWFKRKEETRGNA